MNVESRTMTCHTDQHIEGYMRIAIRLIPNVIVEWSTLLRIRESQVSNFGYPDRFFVILLSLSRTIPGLYLHGCSGDSFTLPQKLCTDCGDELYTA
jgi:hypothetical protein